MFDYAITDEPKPQEKNPRYYTPALDSRVTRTMSLKDIGMSCGMLGLTQYYKLEQWPELREFVTRAIDRENAKLCLVAHKEAWTEARLHNPYEMRAYLKGAKVTVSGTDTKHPLLKDARDNYQSAIFIAASKAEEKLNSYVGAVAHERVRRWLKGPRTFGALCKAFPEVPAEVFEQAFY